MSLLPPRTKEEAIWQNCNYGYDTSKYKSFNDCMTKQGLKIFSGGFPANNIKYTPEPVNVKCNDGSTQSVKSNPMGVDMPCKNNDGVSPNQDVQKPRTFIEMNQGYIIIVLVLVAGYFAYKKFKK